MRIHSLALAGLFVLGAAGAGAQEKKGERPVWHVYRAASPIAVDGELDEPIWKTAPLTPAFGSYRDGSPMKLKTTMRVAWDPKGLCLAICCEEPNPGGMNVAGHGWDEVIMVNYGDSMEIFVDPGATRRGFFQCFANVLNVRGEGWSINYDWDAEWESCASVGRQDYVMEIRFPYEMLGSTPEVGDTWGFNVARNRRNQANDGGNGIQAWSPTHGGLRNPHRFGHIVFAGAPGSMQPRRGPRKVAGGLIMGGGRWGEEDLPAHERDVRAAKLAGLAPVLREFPAPLLTYATPPLRHEQPLPWSVPDRSAIGRPITMSACPGEYEPASLCVFALENLENVLVKVTSLTGPRGNVLASDVVDVRAVVPWYQMGCLNIVIEDKILVPELLLHDASLVEADPESRRNILSFAPGLPRDSAELKPLDIPALETQQYWLTLKAPTGIRAGVYRGEVEILVGGEKAAGVPLEVRIRPFELADPVLDYSLYYCLRLDGKPETEKRMAEEILNQVEHGITMPTTYVNGGDGIRKVIQWQRKAGVRDDKPFVCVTFAVGGQKTEKQFEAIRNAIQSFLKILEEGGRTGGLYVQGIDEAGGERLRSERPAWQVAREAGAKVFVACSGGFWDIVGDILDMPVLAGQLRPDFAKLVRREGHRLFSYGNPQNGVECPEIYRRNYGIALWAAGYDGAMDYEYQSLGENAWDESKSNHYRNHTMAYPALDRPVDTIQWEGWREAVDDVRYVSTLLKLLEKAEPSERVDEIRAWVEGITGWEDLDELREEISRRIIELKR